MGKQETNGRKNWRESVCRHFAFQPTTAAAACAQRVEAPPNMMMVVAMMLEVSLASSCSTALLVLLACSALRWLYQRWQQHKAVARLGVTSTPQTKAPVLEAPREPANSICPGEICKVPRQRTTEDLVASALALLQSQKQRTVIPPYFQTYALLAHARVPFLKRSSGLQRARPLLHPSRSYRVPSCGTSVCCLLGLSAPATPGVLTLHQQRTPGR